MSEGSRHKLFDFVVNLGSIPHTDTVKLLLTGCTQKAAVVRAAEPLLSFHAQTLVSCISCFIL